MTTSTKQMDVVQSKFGLSDEQREQLRRSAERIGGEQGRELNSKELEALVQQEFPSRPARR